MQQTTMPWRGLDESKNSSSHSEDGGESMASVGGVVLLPNRSEYRRREAVEVAWGCVSNGGLSLFLLSQGSHPHVHKLDAHPCRSNTASYQEHGCPWCFNVISRLAGTNISTTALGAYLLVMFQMVMPVCINSYILN